MKHHIDAIVGGLETPAAETLRTTAARLQSLPAEVTFEVGDRLADRADKALQAALSDWLRAAGLRDPEGLSVFLAANAHILPVSTIQSAGQVLPEAG